MNGSLTCVYFLVIGLGVFGMALGCAVSRLLKQGKNGARTITLEIGIQNGPLGGTNCQVEPRWYATARGAVGARVVLADYCADQLNGHGVVRAHYRRREHDTGTAQSGRYAGQLMAYIKRTQPVDDRVSLTEPGWSSLQ